MKKIVAISVMFALVAAAAFAQPTIGGQLKAGATLFSGSNNVDQKEDNTFFVNENADEYKAGDVTEKYNGVSDDIMAGLRKTDAWINAKFGDAEMGGVVRAHARSDGNYHSPRAFAFMWWRPNEYFRIQAGSNPDGDWGGAQITGWGFNGEAQDFVALDKDSGDLGGSTVWVARTAGFYGGISDTAILTSLYPMEGLTVNIGLPWGEAADGRAIDKWLRFHLQVKYDLEDIGTIAVTYEGQGQAQKQVTDRVQVVVDKDGKVIAPFSADNPGAPLYDDDTYAPTAVKKIWRETLDSKNFGAMTGQVDDNGDIVYGIQSPKLWLSFFSNKLVDRLGLDVGFGYQPKLMGGDTPPISIGLGVTYTAEEFGVKLRVGANLLEKKMGVYTAQAWEKVTHDEREALYIDGVRLDGDGKEVSVKKSDRLLSKDGNLWDEWKTGTEIGVNILPYYKLSAFTVYLNAGLGLKFLPTDDGNPNRKWSAEERQKRDKDYNVYKTPLTSAQYNTVTNLPTVDSYYKPEATTSELTWYVNPYIRKSVNGASLMAGVKLWSSSTVQVAGENEWVKIANNPAGTVTGGEWYTSSWSNKINWAIPIGVNVYF